MQPDYLARSALIRRGWVLQGKSLYDHEVYTIVMYRPDTCPNMATERLLSPRTLFFDRTLLWECSELQACETFPEDPPVIPEPCPWATDGDQLRLANLLYDNFKYQGHRLAMSRNVDNPRSFTESAKRAEIYQKWLFVVQFYSQCDLTYKEDLFPALSGLAHYDQIYLGDEYVAGLWKEDILHGLFWVRRQGPIRVASAQYLIEGSTSSQLKKFPLIHGQHRHGHGLRLATKSAFHSCKNDPSQNSLPTTWRFG